MSAINYPNPHPPGCFWHQATETLGAANIKWCEQTLCGPVTEPANAWSNLALVACGALIFALSKNKQKELKYFPLAILFLGLASFFYHASNFYISQLFDFLGIFVASYWLVSLNLMRAGLLGPKGMKVFILATTGVNMISLHFMYLAGSYFQVLVSLGAAVIFITEIVARRRGSVPKNKIWFPASLVFLGLGSAFSFADLTRFWCDPVNHMIQGHALWHVLAAAGIFCAFLNLKEFGELSGQR